MVGCFRERPFRRRVLGTANRRGSQKAKKKEAARAASPFSARLRLILRADVFLARLECRVPEDAGRVLPGGVTRVHADAGEIGACVSNEGQAVPG